MREDKFNFNIEALRKRLNELRRRAEEVPEKLEEMLPEAIEQIMSVLEELDAAKAELNSNEQLRAEIAEKTLRESEERFRTFLESAPETIVVIDHEGRIMFANAKTEGMFGYDWDEMTGQTVEILLPERFRNAHLKHRKDYFSDPRLRPMGIGLDLAGRTKDGTEFPIEVSLSFVETENGILAMGFIRDITVQEQAERALRESEQRYRTLFEESMDVVFISTPDGKFIDINHAGVELFGYSSKEELLQVDIPKDLYLKPSDREIYQRTIEREGYVKDYELLYKRKDGRRLNAIVTAIALRNDEGRVVVYQGVIRDITEERRLKEQLARAERLSAIGQMGAVVAHEIGNPLSAISTSIDLLEIRGKGTNTNLFESIKGEIGRLKNMLTDFSQLAKPYIPERSLGDINLALKEVIGLLEKDEKYRRIALERDLDETMVKFPFDRDRIRQVVWNIILNGLQAMPEGGLLRIRSLNCGDQVKIEVVDSGKGITDAELQSMFEPFYTTKAGGTGLGLSIAAKIIEAHDGKIEVESKVGEGTKFTLLLPIKVGSEERDA